MKNDELGEKIEHARRRLGADLAILGHHYQSDAVIRHVDFQGDSLELARHIPALDARYIVFCGVSFMAETAALLAKPGQKVFIPDPRAHCSMAKTTPARLLADVLERLSAQDRKVVPLAYVNSTVGVKALCGAYGGSVCTSANAATMLDWALGRGDCALFLPDKNLGLNTARRLGLPKQECTVLNVGQDGTASSRSGQLARLFLWPGVCAVHFRIKVADVLRVRQEDPSASILVHPECNPRVVALADFSGSTSEIIRTVDQAPAGASLCIGTEDNLVLRLARRYPDKHVFPLGAGCCNAMGKITEAKLLEALEHLETHEAVKVEAAAAQNSRQALETMLAVMKA